MIVACLDLEGVLFPEIWINVAEITNIPELSLTTRDINDYDKLMAHRLSILNKNNIKIDRIKEVISALEPLDGAKDFYFKLREKFQIIILSDTFYQFAMPLMKKLEYPTIFCHNLILENDGTITGYKLRLKELKKNSVKRLKELNFKTIACGDSYNDILMLEEADRGILFNPPENIAKQFKKFDIAKNHTELWNNFLNAEKKINLKF